ncbi:MAG: alpha/beta hydrolase [Nocardioidaceae bacterium]
MTSDVAHLQGGRRNARAAVLLLHGGREYGTMPTRLTQLSYLRMLDMFVDLRTRGRRTAVHLLRYRVRGWNAGAPLPDPVTDARWALDQITSAHPDAPIALVGHSMGGRTALRVADHPQVVGVCGLAPWLPPGEPLAPADAGTAYVLAHGTGDRVTSAQASLAYAQRLRGTGALVARFELPGAGHGMLESAGLWRRFAVSTALGLVDEATLPPTVLAALESYDPSTLQLPLAAALRSGLPSGADRGGCSR